MSEESAFIDLMPTDPRTGEQRNSDLECQYLAFRPVLFGETSSKPASVEVLEHQTSGYAPLRKPNFVALGEADFCDIPDASAPPEQLANLCTKSGEDWPAWRRELVHEMMHEYEKKIIADHPAKARGEP